MTDSLSDYAVLCDQRQIIPESILSSANKIKIREKAFLCTKFKTKYLLDFSVDVRNYDTSLFALVYVHDAVVKVIEIKKSINLNDIFYFKLYIFCDD